ncbi:alpha/beta-hydrolase [Anaeromyces robustus]|uniref:Alpha/beta-hydrolase n=1 Tax=Anaeromyces robustus TaxID=1754192 RepID=A0A1Y1WBS9_9FUNG|nr:alpha/beta-hydrolase [Anaeromyces robustus]|eukprot:ORX71010.1 alpha/beta-hydrolase [Anaeromyces robustus]
MKVSQLFTLFILSLFIFKIEAGFNSMNKQAQKINKDNYNKEQNLTKDIKFGNTSSQYLDVYHDKVTKTSDELKPVVIYIHGGAWFLDDKYMYSILGSVLHEEGYVAVLPNYVLFPKGVIDDMVVDVYKAIQWTYDNIEQYGGDKNRIILSGHSAGAHLAALTVLKAKFGLKNKNIYLSPLPNLEKLVLMNGPYDFDDFDFISKFFTGSNNIERGIVEKLVTILSFSEYVSPTDVLKPYSDNSLTDLGTTKFNLYWADKDNIVQESSAINFMKQIRRVSPSTTVNYVFNQGNNYDHYTLIWDISFGKEEPKQMFLELIRM